MRCKEKLEMRLRYDAETDAYDDLYSEEQRIKYDLALHHIALSCENRILDCGCGTGIFLEKVADNLRIVVGVDLSPKMLRKAKDRLRNSNVHLLCADFDFLPFPRTSFRYVFIFTALPAPRYWGDSIREMLRVLESDGTITLSVQKKGISTEQLSKKLSMNGLEPRVLVDDQTTRDYLIIMKKGGMRYARNKFPYETDRAVTRRTTFRLRRRES
jgi:ubiquinone/menaquinone biosynthesis C-methylase UbiE